MTLLLIRQYLGSVRLFVSKQGINGEGNFYLVHVLE